MEKIKLNNGIVLNIENGSTENAIGVTSNSVDETVVLFTDENLERYEILTDGNEVCAIHSKKHMKNFSAILLEDGTYLITINLVDVDEVYERLNYLESLVSMLAANNLEELVKE